MRRFTFSSGSIQAALLLTLLAFGPPAPRNCSARAAEPGEVPAAQIAAALYEGIRTETLPNGLRVYLKPIAGSPVVTTMVAYKVGAADEDLSHTGLSHYLEHLMFKGTAKIKPGDIDRLTLRNGGANNAYTSEDYTVYHFDFAADRWEKALEIEADRMRHLRIDAEHEFEQEKGAVIAELERNEDQPWDLEYKVVLPLLFGNGPYGHPVIGERAHVRAATDQVIKAHYDKWYHPNNAALVISGGFDADRALARIKELFGPIPQARLPERKPVPEVIRKGAARKEIESKFEVPRMILGFNTVRIGDPDFYALEVAQAVLSSGKTSRLYRKLIEGEEIASAAEATNSAGRYPGWFGIQVELLKGKDRLRAENLVLAELKRLGDEPISEAELKRVRRGLLAGAVFARESPHMLADSIARGVTTNDLDYLKTYLPRVLAVTPAEVQKAAQKYFDPNQRVVVWSVPSEKGAGQGRNAAPHAGGLASAARQASRAARAAEGDSGGFSLRAAKRVILENGLTLLLFENRRLPIVVAEALVRQGRMLEPADKAGVAALTGNLLDEGTRQRTGQQIAELIEDVGGDLELSSAGGSVKVLTGDRKLGLGLFFECLIQPDFPKDAFTREREQLLSLIEEAERQPDSRAQMVYRSLVYGKHPYGRSGLGTRKTVEALTPEDCRAYHRQVFVPNNTIVAIVGDFDSKEMIEEVTRLTAAWKPAPLPKLEKARLDRIEQFTEKIVSMPEAAQLHFYLGHPGIRRNNVDFHKLLVMDYVLGVGPGFTDRLSARLRDREGLAYTVNASITGSAGDEPGLFTCYIGTEPGNFLKVKRMFLEELNRIRDEKAREQEVEDAKSYLLGSLPFQFTTNDRIAGQLLAIERYQLGFDYLADYRKAVAAVTPEDVLEVARRYLDPKNMVLVAAGALDQQGKPLARPVPREKP